MDSKDDLDSVCSSFSQVSFNGEEVSAEVAVDESIKQIQQGLNNLQVGMRELLMLDERDESYEVIQPKYEEIEALVKDGVSLWKDMLAIARQLRVPKPRATKKESQKTGVLDQCKTGGS
jgi:hypothetical protein